MPVDTTRLNQLADELSEAIVSYRPRWLIYDDGGGPWRCNVVDEEERGPGPLEPGGTLLRIEADAGMSFGVHCHFTESEEACTEVFTLIKGVFEVTPEGEDTKRLSPGDCLRIPPGQLHCVHAVTACVVWAASIPTARGYGYVPADNGREAAGVRGGDAWDGSRAEGGSGGPGGDEPDLQDGADG